MQQKQTMISDLKDLSFNDFLKCAVENNYSCLVLCDIATDRQVTRAWDKLRNDYCALTRSQDLLKAANSVFEIMAFRTKHIQTTGLIEAL